VRRQRSDDRVEVRVVMESRVQQHDRVPLAPLLIEDLACAGLDLRHENTERRCCCSRRSTRLAQKSASRSPRRP
jgi:hypothetical protein